jgi:hypothetical protein
MRSGSLFALYALWLAGCGSTPRMREGALYPGRVEGEPALECLPDPDVADSELTERMRFARRLAAEAFALADPALPADDSAAALMAWSSGPLRAWLHAKTEAVEAARRELDLAAEESHRQRVMSGAIVGMLYEDVAAVIRRIPTPDDLRSDPEIGPIFREVVDGEALPYLETARRAYHACEVNGTMPATMRHWSAFCGARLDLLPSTHRPGEDFTEVEVIVE